MLLNLVKNKSSDLKLVLRKRVDYSLSRSTFLAVFGKTP